MTADAAVWLKEALRLAEVAASEDEVPVGAVVVHQNQIIGRGYNRREQDQSPTSHAEIRAISEAAETLKTWRLNGCVLYVTLEPCPMCLAACQQARLDLVVYGTPDPKGGALSLGYNLHTDVRLNHRFDVSLCHTPECSKILTEFFKKKRT